MVLVRDNNFVRMTITTNNDNDKKKNKKQLVREQEKGAWQGVFDVFLEFLLEL